MSEDTPITARSEPAEELPRLTQALAGAADDRIRRVVARVDAMPVRGDADGLIAPLRPRLAQLRPIRPLNFTRLLFLPLEPMILGPADWRRGAPGLPRPAMAVLAREARRDLPDAEEIERQSRDATTLDTDLILSLGARVWGAAGSRLLTMPRPDDWDAATGLSEQDHPAVARVAAIVLSNGLALMRLAHQPPPPASLDSELEATGAAAVALSNGFLKADKMAAVEPGPASVAPLATYVALLMLRSPRADRALAAIEKLGGAEKQTLLATQMALDLVLARMVALASVPSLAAAADAMRHAAIMLPDLESLMEVRPAPRQRLLDVRARLDAACRTRFVAAIQDILAEPGGLPPLEREILTRDARRFEESARRIGSARAYDEARQICAARLAESSDSRLTPETRARMVRIMTEPEQSEAAG